jgi:hypothetical protein
MGSDGGSERVMNREKRQTRVPAQRLRITLGPSSNSNNTGRELATHFA